MEQTILTHFITICGLTGISLSTMAAVVLFFGHRAPRLESRTLAFFLLIHSWTLLNSIMISSGFLMWAPQWYRGGSPVHYLIPVSAWLYVRVSLGQELRLRRWDWLMFVPAVLHLLEMLPFYLMPYSEKAALVSDNYAHHPDNFLRFTEGILPAYIHSFIKEAMFLASAALQWTYYLQWRRQSHPSNSSDSSGFSRWMLVFISANIAFYLSIFLPFLGFMPDHWAGLSIINIILSFFLIIVSAVLFFSPQVLYGVENLPVFPGEQAGEEQSADRKTFELPAELRDNFKMRIEELMQREQPFLQRGYTIRQLSEQINVPQHHLSAVFRQEYGVNFNEFINRHRVAHVLQMLERLDQRQTYTLESIAADSGFNARNTFFLAFKKATGFSPKEYLNQMQHSQ